MQAGYEHFCKDAENFVSDLYQLYTSDGRDRITWRAAGERWLPQSEYDEVMNKIAKLDRQATGLSKSWEALIIVARDELKGASLGIDRYEQ